MAMTVKAIVNRLTGTRIEGAELDERLMKYAENNRDQFSFVYYGDVIEGDTIEPAEVAAPANTYTTGNLKPRRKEELLDILAGMGVSIEGDATKDEIIDMILETQAKGV
jgi:hypothetical protein